MAPPLRGRKPFREIGKRLEVVRRLAGVRTKAAFAKSIGITPSSYNLFANGGRRLTLETALAISARYGTSLDWLYLGRGHPTIQREVSWLRDGDIKRAPPQD